MDDDDDLLIARKLNDEPQVGRTRHRHGGT